ncbi:Peptidyl-prolyl cis-trans isomerase [gamma proteobacterium HdN1]|nr:Peptidyl-prolyl cis-trans isomerase [gamma proteobacterium HdN1]
MKNLLIYSALALSPLLPLAASTAYAATAPVGQNEQLLDRVVAVVDDDIILQSELLNRTRQIRIQIAKRGTEAPDEAKLQAQVLERMITESAELQLAEKMGVRVDDNAINEALANIARQNNLSLEQFQNVIEHEEGMTFASYREQVRREMTAHQLQQRRVASRIKISDQDIDAFLASDLGKENLAPDYHLGHILIAVHDDSDAASIDQAKAMADEVYRQLKSGADFAATAVRYSGDDKALEGGDLGWRKAGQLPTLFADVVVNMHRGDISAPIRSPSGFHIIKILETRGGTEMLVPQAQVRHILIKPNEIRSDADAHALAEDIRRRLQQNKGDFAALAKTYSDDTGSALEGGSLGWVNPGVMVPEFEKVMNSEKIGTISQPFRTQFGWHILEVTERRKQDMTSEFKRNRARQMLFKRKFDEDLATWLREVRQDAYVEIKP